MGRHHSLKLCAGLAAVLAAACSGGGGGSSQGQLSLGLVDASVDGVSSIVIDVTGVRLKPQGGPAFDVTYNGGPVDLLTLTGVNREMLLADQTVPAGVYEWLEIDVNEAGSYVMVDGQQMDLLVPSGSQSGLRLVSPFTITADQQNSFTIDWNMRMGLTNPPGQMSYLLKPAFRVIDDTQYGTLSGTVTDTGLTGCVDGGGYAVYVYDYFDTSTETPGDIGATQNAPIATADVKLDQNSNYTYSMILSSPGDYTVAFTCEAAMDTSDPDQPISFVLPTSVDGAPVNTGDPEPVVHVDTGGTTVVDF